MLAHLNHFLVFFLMSENLEIQAPFKLVYVIDKLINVKTFINY